jgi:hypothetical protein
MTKKELFPNISIEVGSLIKFNKFHNFQILRKLGVLFAVKIVTYRDASVKIEIIKFLIFNLS